METKSSVEYGTKTPVNNILGKVLGPLVLSSTLLTGSVESSSCSQLPDQEQIIDIDYELETKPSWEQDFESMTTTRIDEEVWNYDTRHQVPTWNDGVIMGYTDSIRNIRIEPGTGLIIEAIREKHVYEDDPKQVERSVTSARINNRGNFAEAYGRFEFTAKMPDGNGLWPAFWLLSFNRVHGSGLDPEDYEDDKRFYLKVGGEIDVLEYYSKNKNQVTGAFHSYNNSIMGCVVVSNLTTDFHTYAVDLTPEGAVWSVDGVPYFSVESSQDSDEWPYIPNDGEDNRNYMVINLAVGGAGGEIDDNLDSWAMAVKNVRHYNLKTAN